MHPFHCGARRIWPKRVQKGSKMAPTLIKPMENHQMSSPGNIFFCMEYFFLYIQKKSVSNALFPPLAPWDPYMPPPPGVQGFLKEFLYIGDPSGHLIYRKSLRKSLRESCILGSLKGILKEILKGSLKGILEGILYIENP